MTSWGKRNPDSSSSTHHGQTSALSEPHRHLQEQEEQTTVSRHSHYTHKGIKTHTREVAHAALQIGGYTCLFLVGWKVGTCLLRRTGRLLFGKRHGKQPAASIARRTTERPSSITQVPPAMHWRPIAPPPPDVPQDYKLLASSNLPCSVYNMYHYLLSQQSDFLQTQHEQIGGQFNYVKGPWCPAPLDMADYPQPQDGSLLQGMAQSVFEVAVGCGNSGSFVRTCTFMTPRKPPMSADGQCVQRQQFAVFEGGVLVLATCMNTLNLPYNNCFLVNTIWHVTPSADSSLCTVSIYGKVHFIKKPFVAAIIKATTISDLTSFYKPLLPNAVAFLQQEPAVPEPSTMGGTEPPRGLPFRRRASPNRGFSTGQPGVPAGLPISSDGKKLAQTVPLRRQLRVAVVMLFFLGSIVHQLILHQQLHGLHAQLTQH